MSFGGVARLEGGKVNETDIIVTNDIQFINIHLPTRHGFARSGSANNDNGGIDGFSRGSVWGRAAGRLDTSPS